MPQYSYTRPQAILFDLGDTILGNQQFDPVAGNAHLLGFAEQTRLSAAEVRAVAQELDDLIIPLRQATVFEFTAESFNRLLFERLGIALSISYAQAAYEFWHASVTFTPEPGIDEVLRYLTGAGIRRGIISNSVFSGAVLEAELAKHNLGGAFEFLLSSADYGIRKPHPLLFEIGLARLGLEAEAVWFVGDRLEADIVGAKAVGLCAVWYNRRRKSREAIVPDVEVQDWQQFVRLLQTL
jgi:putative hydrolase of the HAD superfamily